MWAHMTKRKEPERTEKFLPCSSSLWRNRIPGKRERRARFPRSASTRDQNRKWERGRSEIMIPFDLFRNLHTALRSLQDLSKYVHELTVFCTKASFLQVGKMRAASVFFLVSNSVHVTCLWGTRDSLSVSQVPHASVSSFFPGPMPTSIPLHFGRGEASTQLMCACVLSLR